MSAFSSSAFLKIALIIGLFCVITNIISDAVPHALSASRETDPALTIAAFPGNNTATSSAISGPLFTGPRIVPKPLAQAPTQPQPPTTAEATTPDTLETPLPVVPSVPPPEPTILNLKTRESVVNILCTTKSAGSFDPISGSGVIIDSRGIILTNAHVAQYFLLKDLGSPGFITCTVRTGSPAEDTYTAELIYISPRWISTNAAKIKLSHAPGTGENDFALLRITGTTNPNKRLPASFTASVPDTTFNTAHESHSVLLVSYPAELLGGILTQTSLNQVSSIATIKKSFFFEGNTPDVLDVMALGGNIVAQGGSSGGAVVNSDDGTLIGILVTSTSADSTDDKNLSGLSLSHIDRGFQAETGMTLSGFLSADPGFLQTQFERNSFAKLEAILENAVRSQ